MKELSNVETDCTARLWAAGLAAYFLLPAVKNKLTTDSLQIQSIKR